MKLNLTEIEKLVDMGYVVIPLCSSNHKGMTSSHIKGCTSPGKRPLVSNWTNITNVSREQFKAWSEQFPTANWGMVLGQTLYYNLVGIDIDGVEGEEYWKQITKDKVLPDTVEFSTGAGRRILYQLPYGLQTKKNKTTLDGAHAEVAFCCQGQQTVIPPSVHHTGRKYEWVPGKSPFEIDVAQAPQWIIDLVSIKGKDTNSPNAPKENKSQKVTAKEMKEKVTEGGRNNQLTRLMGSMIARTDMSLEVALGAALSMNETQFDPPLDENEVIRTVTSVWEIEQRKKDQRERKQMDAEEMAPVNLARLFISDMEEQGIYYRYYAERDMFYMAELQTPPWRYISNAKIEAYISAFLRGITPKLDVQRNRTEVRKCMANLMMMDAKYDGEKLDIGLHPYEDLIAVKNGVLDWKTGKLHPWNPLKHTHSSVIEAPMMKIEHFEEELKTWESALEEWLPEKENRLFLQEYMGYSLLPKNDMRTALFLLGGGSNGKSLFIEIVQKLFEGSVAVTQPESLASRFGTNILLDKLLYVCADVDQTYLDKTGVLKQIIAGDIIPSEIKNGASFHFRPVGKLIISANDMPRAKDSTEGWYSRLQIVPFNRTFAKNPRYKRMLEATFDKEEGRAALLYWCVEGLRRLSETYEWTISNEMSEELRKYKAENDSVIQFFDECLEKTNIEDAYLETPTLYEVYTDWCMESNQKPVTRKIFSNRLTKLNIEIKPKVVKKPLGKKTIRCCFGLKFQDTMDFDADTLYKMKVAN